VRYVVVAWPAGGADPALPRDAMLAALYQRNGNPLVGDDARDVVPALRRHRLIHESRPLDRSNPKNPPYLKVFEVVTGASISGRASPGATVTASLELSLDRGRTFEYRNRSVAGADGRYRIVVPYANQDPPPGLRATGSYRIACGSDSGSLDVHERDVRDGTQLRGPDLCLPETAARR